MALISAVNVRVFEDIVKVNRDVLVANGKHTLNLQLINGG